jgi:hypothetical protein
MQEVDQLILAAVAAEEQETDQEAAVLADLVS